MLIGGIILLLANGADKGGWLIQRLFRLQWRTVKSQTFPGHCNAIKEIKWKKPTEAGLNFLFPTEGTTRDCCLLSPKMNYEKNKRGRLFKNKNAGKSPKTDWMTSIQVWLDVQTCISWRFVRWSCWWQCSPAHCWLQNAYIRWHHHGVHIRPTPISFCAFATLYIRVWEKLSGVLATGLSDCEIWPLAVNEFKNKMEIKQEEQE